MALFTHSVKTSKVPTTKNGKYKQGFIAKKYSALSISRRASYLQWLHVKLHLIFKFPRLK